MAIELTRFSFVKGSYSVQYSSHFKFTTYNLMKITTETNNLDYRLDYETKLQKKLEQIGTGNQNTIQIHINKINCMEGTT